MNTSPGKAMRFTETDRSIVTLSTAPQAVISKANSFAPTMPR